MENQKITQEEVDLIKRAQTGEKSAFNQIFYKYKYFVESILKSYMKDDDEARDICNIVFCKVNDKLPSFREYTSFGGWLRTLTKNTAIDYLRTQKHNRNIISLDDPDTQVMDTIFDESDIANQMTFERVLKKIDTLPENKRIVLIMYYRDNHTISSISKRLCIPVNTVKSILHRFRKQIFEQLQIQ